MDQFLIMALLGGLGIALITGPLGSFMVWRRMAYFGDTLAHSGLLGVALGLLMAIEPLLGLVVTTTTVAILLFILDRQTLLPTDTLLGILSHGSLSLGLVALGLIHNPGIDLNGLLFGDVLTLNWNDIAWIYAIGIAALLTLTVIWKSLLLMTVSMELAAAEGVAITRIQLIFLLLLAFTIAIAMKAVGILLITSLLIVPAATARRLARSPEQMALFASLLGSLSVFGGLLMSYWWDLASGPAIVIFACLLFMASLFRRQN
ncbi:metal ABC transporter permease [Gynuella sunshinyii]|uniref:High-affinity zinc uptake system membrane protein ZnuB n=1 Tax=Gynuella sunshinyii YC6258 TaxID=1445510 RepID=A0A0C5VNN5_9GAMM|nr:metal ABC transporter permease [Gynuella sunshinyii]AJQ95926.1 ABC-type Mn2+/Zn2+ transport system, permease component [Gynuella sunshinyii YC6258]